MTVQRKRLGAWVTCVPRPWRGPRKAQIIDERPGIARGAVYLSVPLNGARWWNKRDLVVTSAPTEPER